MRYKRVLCGIDGSRVIFELYDGGCAMVGVDSWDGVAFNLLPESFMKHMPYDSFVPAVRLSQSTISAAISKIENYSGDIPIWHASQLARFKQWMERNWPE